MKPILKWVGGKTGLLPEILKRLPAKINTYREPFVGGGAVFFALRSRIHGQMHLNDANRDLMSFYEVLSGPETDFSHFLFVLDNLRGADPESAYYIARDAFNGGRESRPFCQAAYFLLLNKNGYNGLWRVNASGKQNVPWGHYENVNLPNTDELIEAREALSGVYLNTGDFEEEMRHLDKDHVCYCDPPYLPVSATSFTKYSQTDFSIEDHVRLAKAFKEAAGRGAKLLLSNSYTPFTRELYDGFLVETVYAARSVNNKGTGRGKVAEILVSANLEGARL